MFQLDKLTSAGLFACAVALSPAAVAAQETAPAAEPEWVDYYTDADAKAVLDARLIALKTVLQLTPQQEALWPPVEAEIRRISTDARARGQERQTAEPPNDFLDVLDRIAGAEATRAADLQAFVKASRPLFSALDEAQRIRAPAFLGMVDSPDGPQPSSALWLFEDENG